MIYLETIGWFESRPWRIYFVARICMDLYSRRRGQAKQRKLLRQIGKIKSQDCRIHQTVTERFSFIMCL